MKAVRIHGYGGNDVVVYEDAPRPEPAEGEVLVRIRASGVNPVDWNIREGYLRTYSDPPLPIILGRDFAGDVVALGPNTSGFAVGDAVYGNVDFRTGTYAEYVAAPITGVAAKPTSVDYETAAAVPLSALAAWQTLLETAQLEEGQKVLIHAGAGGVGSFAIQIARAHGARVIATSSEANLDLLRDLGADEVIDYHAARFEDGLSDVDIVLDTVGGDTQDRSWAVLKPGGMQVTLLFPTPASAEMSAAHNARSAMVGTRADGAQLEKIAFLIDNATIKPVVGTVLPLSEVSHALELSQTRHARGKIVLHVSNA